MHSLRERHLSLAKQGKQACLLLYQWFGESPEISTMIASLLKSKAYPKKNKNKIHPNLTSSIRLVRHEETMLILFPQSLKRLTTQTLRKHMKVQHVKSEHVR